ncbi:alpha-(1,3)-fucosyltransferase 10-like [Haliotis cracherodii]|uniref:alpha-(1,3)-fucosyltransferase 10-like n=1 Tax=Haliotis cracherodii TaxID=6455 RepID=UPI0039EC5E38
MSSKFVFRCFLLVFLFGFLGMLILGYKIFSSSDDHPVYYDNFLVEVNEDRRPLDEELEEENIVPGINKPIILWWTPFTGEKGIYKKCGNVKCFFTVRRAYRNHPMTSVFVFYGTDFKVTDLPLPRSHKHEWALLHEESPKNNYLFSHPEIMTLFNYTSTFKRESSYPITTQYLVGTEWLESTQYLISTGQKNKHQKKLAPLMYAHSDCDVPSDRDHYVKMLQKYIKVDSYGTCLHNKDLPEHLKDPIQGMDHKDFYKLAAKYKFSLAMENGICDDYITEKVWRPLMVGSLPVVMGSPKIKELLPSNHSAIIVDDFSSVKELADYLKYLNKNDAEYEKYFKWKETGITNTYLKKLVEKREWGVDSEEHWSPATINFIDGFECHICNAVHKNLNQQQKGQPPFKHRVTNDHYGCPAPLKFDDSGKRTHDEDISRMWQWDWFYGGQVAKAARSFIDQNITFTSADLKNKLQKVL